MLKKPVAGVRCIAHSAGEAELWVEVKNPYKPLGGDIFICAYVLP
jgi:hypothetical protein